MDSKIKAGVVGATGYAGAELVRLLAEHPAVIVDKLSSVSFSGQDISKIYPSFRSGLARLLEPNHMSMLDACDVLFGALPHGLSQPIAADCAAKGKVFIDLGADFRLTEEEVYTKWYDGHFDDPDLHAEAVYGLCEINRADIRKARLIANPGCYPTSAILGLYPALAGNLIETTDLIIDAKSGVTGAGRGLSQTTHFPESSQSFAGYKIGLHRHTPEIEQALTQISGQPVAITFVPHLLPVNRGILSTIYCRRRSSLSEVRAHYEAVYADEPFVTVLREGEFADIKNVRQTNCCHISLHEDDHTDKLIICSAIDNMVKGAAGQAIQNMNLIFGLEETTGLPRIAPAF